MLHITRKPSGGASTTVITHRTYLTDARFLVVLEGDAVLLQRCAKALEDPCSGAWFGRKCCLPASPLSPILGTSRQDAMARWVERWKEIRPQMFQGGQEEAKAAQALGEWFQHDQPVSYATRGFRSRPVHPISP